MLQFPRSFGDVTALAVLGLGREAGRLLIGSPPAGRGGFRKEDAIISRRGGARRPRMRARAVAPGIPGAVGAASALRAGS